MRRVLCLVGIHHYEHHVNREVAGRSGGYEVCSNCSREKGSRGMIVRKSQND
jgi:hypothetical protein